MTDLSKHYDHVRKSLREGGYDVDHLENLASLLIRMDQQQYDISFAEFHNFAGRLPYVSDSDFGALILEREADISATGHLRTRLYREAMWRAQWCAQSATAGGEGLARKEDVERLLGKIQEAQQEMATPMKPSD